MIRTLPALLLLLSLAFLTACRGPEAAPEATPAPGISRQSRHLALRLAPGQDLAEELRRAVDEHGLSAVGVVTCVGSLTEVTLRYANQEEATKLSGHFEIVSLVGTLEPGGGHLHIAVSDGQGQTLAGHLLDGSKVYTTAEIVLVSLDDLNFTRKPDPVTTYHELSVERR